MGRRPITGFVAVLRLTARPTEGIWNTVAFKQRHSVLGSVRKGVRLLQGLSEEI